MNGKLKSGRLLPKCCCSDTVAFSCKGQTAAASKYPTGIRVELINNTKEQRELLCLNEKKVARMALM